MLGDISRGAEPNRGEIEPGRFGDGRDLELARAYAEGDFQTVGEISMLRSVRYMREEEGRPPGGPMHDSSSPLLNPGSRRGGGTFRDR